MDTPYIREKGKLRAATWSETLAKAKTEIKNKKIFGLIGDLVSVEASFALKQFVEGLGGSVECRIDNTKLPSDNRSAYVGTAMIEDVDTAEIIYIIGSNPRDEAPTFNARIRKAWSNGAEIKVIGEPCDLTYDYRHCGQGRKAIRELIQNESSIAASKKSLIILGQGALSDKDGMAVLAKVMELVQKTGSKFLNLHTAASRVGALDIGAVADGDMLDEIAKADVIYNLGADEIELDTDAFVIYQGSHGDRGAHNADIIFPAAAYTEESGLFVNTEGRPQLCNRANFAPGEAKENWAIIRALSSELGNSLPFNNLAQLRKMLTSLHPNLGCVDEVPVNDWKLIQGGRLLEKNFKNKIPDFYLTNPIARASSVMAELSANAKARAKSKVAAE